MRRTFLYLVSFLLLVFLVRAPELIQLVEWFRNGKGWVVYAGPPCVHIAPAGVP